MKKTLLILTIVGVLGIGAFAFAHGPGWWGGGTMGMMGPGMMWSNAGYTCPGPVSHLGYDSKFLNETKNLRKALVEKRFEYFEALRNPETTPETLAKLEKEIYDLQNRILQKAPKVARGYGRGFHAGGCWW